MDLARARGFFAPFRGPWLRKADSRGLIDVLAAARKPCGLLLSPSPRRRAESQQSGIRRYSKLSKAPTSPSLPFAPASFDTCESRRGARRGGTGANRGFRSKSLRQSSAAGAGRCKLSTSNPRKMKGYHDIVGGGGSRILEQVAEQRARITDSLAGVRHLVAVGSGKGGVGEKHPDATSRERAARPGLQIAILDADFNGPSQARMAGVQGAVFVAGTNKVALPWWRSLARLRRRPRTSRRGARPRSTRTPPCGRSRCDQPRVRKRPLGDLAASGRSLWRPAEAGTPTRITRLRRDALRACRLASLGGLACLHIAFAARTTSGFSSMR